MKFLSSLKFGLVLMAVIIIASIVATVKPELQIFSSYWFRGLLLLLSLNLIFCTSRRLPAVLRRINKDISFLDEKSNKFQTKSVQDTREYEKFIDNFFKKKGYKYKKETSAEKTKYAAKKGTSNLVAPHLLHLALVIVLIGAILGSYGHEEKIWAAVGEVVPVPREISENMDVHVKDFRTLYDKENNIDNWQSKIELRVNGETVATGTTKVNHPFKYKGIVFYQTAYDYKHEIKITGLQDGTYEIPNNRVFNLAGRFFKVEQLKDGPVIKIYESHRKFDTVKLEEGKIVQFPQETTLQYLGTTPYTVLTAKKDPGVPVVMVGFALMTLSSILFWSGRYREIKITLDHNKKALHVSVNCKAKTIKEEIMNDLLRERMQEG